MIEKITLTGSAKEIGMAHGKHGKKQVLTSLETYEQLFYDYQQLTWEKAKAEALTYLPAIEAYDADLLAEMEGIAIGAGVDFEDILALNARTEIALGSYGGSRAFSDGCTVIGTQTPVSNDTIIGQNWDWKGSQKESILLLEIKQQNKPKITMLTEGGMIGKIGYNDAGIGLCFNALLTDKKTLGVPIHIALRGLLNSETLGEAISKVDHGQVAASASLLIGYADEAETGMVVNLEVSPFGLDFIGGEEGYFMHTNHIISPKLKEHLADRNEYRYQDSYIRYKRAKQLVQTAYHRRQPVDEYTFQSWFADQFNAPSSINHFANSKVDVHRQMETVFSVVFNLSKRKAYALIGKPSEGKYLAI